MMTYGYDMILGGTSQDRFSFTSTREVAWSMKYS